MTKGRRVALVVAAVVLGLGVAGCGGPSSADAHATPADRIQTLSPDLLGGELLGLTIGAEDMGESLSGARRSFVDAAGLYGLRDGDGELQATLQVTRFNAQAQPSSPNFRHGLVSKLGGSIPKAIRLGDEEVFVARRSQQLRAAWFDERWFFVLTTNAQLDRPLALLREVLEIEL